MRRVGFSTKINERIETVPNVEWCTLQRVAPRRRFGWLLTLHRSVRHACSATTETRFASVEVLRVRASE